MCYNKGVIKERSNKYACICVDFMECLYIQYYMFYRSISSLYRDDEVNITLGNIMSIAVYVFLDIYLFVR